MGATCEPGAHFVWRLVNIRRLNPLSITWQGLNKQTTIITLHQCFWLFKLNIGVPGRAIPPGHICSAMDLVSNIGYALLFP
jgi:hypothetical protein